MGIPVSCDGDLERVWDQNNQKSAKKAVLMCHRRNTDPPRQNDIFARSSFAISRALAFHNVLSSPQLAFGKRDPLAFQRRNESPLEAVAFVHNVSTRYPHPDYVSCNRHSKQR